MKSATGTSPATVHDALLKALRAASDHNRSDVVAPAAILWTDKERRWEAVVPRLRGELPLLALGSYAPEEFTGPAIWLRCVIAGTLPEVELPDGTPIIYLPGSGRADLRAVEDCPPEVRPLAELQYRGGFFTHRNARDWTPAGFLQNRLGVKVSEDTATRQALARALPKLLNESVLTLEAQSPIKAAYLDSLLIPDPDRELLRWLDGPKGYGERIKGEDPAVWAAFRRICADQYGFDPVDDGEVTAAGLLGERRGAWRNVWRRFADASKKYPNLPALLDRARPEKMTLFEPPAPYWPQDNREQEDLLRESLSELSGKPGPEARAKILALEAEHGERRGWVWAEFGEAPLAGALLHLAALVEATKSLGSGTPEELAAYHASEGWKADWATLEALASVETERDSAAVKAAVESVYRPWLEESTRRFQKAVAEAPLPAPVEADDAPEPESGVCVLFTDGLRYDVARHLAGVLEEQVARVELGWRFSAIPGVTATAKPAISPIGPLLGPGEGFGATVNGSRVTADSLRLLLREGGYEILAGGTRGTPSGAAWTELGNLDAAGHNRGWKMAREVRRSARELADRILDLLEAGWREVRVITDHGWLLLPGGLPKAELPEHLTTVRKGRCARLRDGANASYQVVPWSLDSDVRVAVAPGIHAFEAGKEYEHGGLSPQECVVPVLTVTASAAPTTAANIAEVKWTGLRCKVRVEDAPENAKVDLRSRAADPSASITSAKPIKPDRTAALFVADDTREFEAAILVVLDSEGRVLAQVPTVVGG